MTSLANDNQSQYILGLDLVDASLLWMNFDDFLATFKVFELMKKKIKIKLSSKNNLWLHRAEKNTTNGSSTPSRTLLKFYQSFLQSKLNVLCYWVSCHYYSADIIPSAVLQMHIRGKSTALSAWCCFKLKVSYLQSRQRVIRISACEAVDLGSIPGHAEYFLNVIHIFPAWRYQGI